jgi:protein-L-isoaspartate(D-aspartate) O-methyltransferase
MSNSKDQLIRKLLGEGVIQSKKVISALTEIDRGFFYSGSGIYEDRPQRLGFQATISAPHMHGYALEYLKDYLLPNTRALDVGSGSGYLTACMSHMMDFTGKVVGVEHIPELVNNSIRCFERHLPGVLGNSVEIIETDGRLGYSRHAPYKAIHVGACVESIPSELLNQLDNDGRMMVPVGKHGKTQEIILVDKDSTGRVSSRSTLSVVYVPLCDKNFQLGR